MNYMDCQPPPYSLTRAQFSAATALFRSNSGALVLVGGLGDVLLGERSSTTKQLLPLKGA